MAPLTGTVSVETVVIGAGFVGTAAARRLAENQPDHSFLLLEALKVGQGASGRNSGFVIDQPHKRELELGDDELKRKIVRLNREAISYMEQQIDRYDIECQWSHAGKYQAAVSKRGEAYLSHYESLLKNAGEKYQRLQRSELEEVTGSAYYSSAIYTEGGVLMQPAALMRGMAMNMPENVRVAEDTPVLDIQRKPGGFLLKTPDAEVHCRSLILATNIFTPELGYMGDRILPIMTFASMTPPLTDAQLKRYGGSLDWGLTPADHAGTTVRMTQDRRLIIRNSHHYAHDYNTPAALLPDVKRRHREGFDARYPQLSDVELEYTWGGASSLSRNFETFFGQLDEGVYTSACDQCVGAARGTISGMMLADMVSGKDSEMLRDMQLVSGKPARLPPKPLLKVGVPMRLKMARVASRSEI